MAEEHTVNWGKPEIEAKYKTEGTKTCFDVFIWDDQNIVDFLNFNLL